MYIKINIPSVFRPPPPEAVVHPQCDAAPGVSQTHWTNQVVSG